MEMTLFSLWPTGDGSIVTRIERLYAEGGRLDTGTELLEVLEELTFLPFLLFLFLIAMASTLVAMASNLYMQFL